MGRHEYTEDGENWEIIRWRGMVASATRGQRGRRLLRELREALDAMPEKRLIKGALVTEDGECCALGSVLVARGEPSAHEIDSEGNNDFLAEKFDVAECLVQEIEWVNDESDALTPEDRWKDVSLWVDKCLK